MTPRPLVIASLLFASISYTRAADARFTGRVSHMQEKTPVATSDKAYPPQLSGTVVDTSGAVIAGATVQVRSANGTVQRTTQSDTNGSFIISGLAGR